MAPFAPIPLRVGDSYSYSVDQVDLRSFQPFLDRLAGTRLGPWRAGLERVVLERTGVSAHGDLGRWEMAVDALPELAGGLCELRAACVGVTSTDRPAPDELMRLRDGLQTLHPWRKGPYCIHGVRIETEWRSDWKWDRLVSAIEPLDGRLVLDVGCGNGYHGWRMLGEGAALVLGIDPTLLYAVQFRAINRYLNRDELGVLPLKLEDLPRGLAGFDTLFSLGVLYHRRSPIDHLLRLRDLLRPGGELVLETLILDGGGPRVLLPPGRYAGMRNVWFLPTVESLSTWLGRCGFVGVRVVDVTPTTTQEQRTTEWMRFQSLADHLDPSGPGLTVEGLPAPIRAILVARAPEHGR